MPGSRSRLSTVLTPELEPEGMARDASSARCSFATPQGDRDLEETERIEILWAAVDSDRHPEEIQATLDRWRETIPGRDAGDGGRDLGAEEPRRIVLVGVHTRSAAGERAEGFAVLLRITVLAGTVLPPQTQYCHGRRGQGGLTPCRRKTSSPRNHARTPRASALGDPALKGLPARSAITARVGEGHPLRCP